MAMTELTLVFLGSLATLTSIAVLRGDAFGDRWTRLLVEALAALLWGLFGLGSFDVIVRDTAVASASEPILPLAYLGIGLSVLVGMYFIYDLLHGIGREASEAREEELLG